MMEKKRRRRLMAQHINASVDSTQEVVAANLIQNSPKKLCIAGIAGLRAQAIPRTHERIIGGQMSIDAALTKPVVHQDLRAANNAALTTAIADFWHAENIPDRAVDSARFKNIISRARLVGPDYKHPNRKDIGGCLLDENASAYKTGNFVAITKEGPKFGYVFEGDGATVITKPLFNGMVMHGNCYPVVAAIRDCSEHLAAGGTKNCTYIADVFTELVREYDPNGTDADIFYFDGAANVQKAGRILEARFPRTTALYGGEHNLALWFSKVAKIPVIRVRKMKRFACFFHEFTNH